jgi:hypothetical protein
VWCLPSSPPYGKNFYARIQHNISGKATILDITGWHY